jgi:hypothetical protein
MKKTFLILLMAGLVSWTGARAQDDPFEAIATALQEADAKNLAEHFNKTVELQLPGSENTHSSSQAELIMKDFFKNYPPDSFKIVQKGTTDATSRFAIGEYASGRKTYQVYIHLKSESDKYLIQKLKFNENR